MSFLKDLLGKFFGKKIKPIPQPKIKIEKSKLCTWKYEDLSCKAYNKSDARAYFKTELGLKRLPIGAIVEKE